MKKILNVEHHLSHAAGAYMMSGFKKSFVLLAMEKVITNLINPT